MEILKPLLLSAVLSPITGDQINTIIMFLCLSGIGLIVILLLTLREKTKKK